MKSACGIAQHPEPLQCKYCKLELPVQIDSAMKRESKIQRVDVHFQRTSVFEGMPKTQQDFLHWQICQYSCISIVIAVACILQAAMQRRSSSAQDMGNPLPPRLPLPQDLNPPSAPSSAASSPSRLRASPVSDKGSMDRAPSSSVKGFLGRVSSLTSLIAPAPVAKVDKMFRPSGLAFPPTHHHVC